jgi:proline dehydrogenase
MTTKKQRISISIVLTSVLVITGLLYFYGEQWLRDILLYLSAADWARYTVSNVPLARRVAGRFIAGETIADAIRVAREMNRRGMLVTLNYLGEHVTSSEEAAQAGAEIACLLDKIYESGVRANVSIKPSQLGLQDSRDILYRNLAILLKRARQYDNRIRIDMEESTTVDTTLAMYRQLRDEEGFGDHVGVVIQAYLYRSEADVTQLITEGAWVRLCKGAYMEPAHIAFPEKADTDANYIHLMQKMLSEEARQHGMYVGLATHDEKMVEAVIRYAQAHNVPADAFEFQMLYGVRTELQAALVARGYQVRVYIPYGTAWYPYFTRRLAERPANLWFFISNLLRK